jgi:hypothetical protein
MGRNTPSAKTGRRHVRVDMASPSNLGMIVTEIEITGNFVDDMRRADTLRSVTTYQSQLAARGIDYALQQNLPQGTYQVSGNANGGPVTIAPYGE